VADRASQFRFIAGTVRCIHLARRGEKLNEEKKIQQAKRKQSFDVILAHICRWDAATQLKRQLRSKLFPKASKKQYQSWGWKRAASLLSEIHSLSASYVECADGVESPTEGMTTCAEAVENQTVRPVQCIIAPEIPTTPSGESPNPDKNFSTWLGECTKPVVRRTLDSAT